MEKEAISTSKAPKPIGNYSQAIKVGNALYVSGQIALLPDGNTLANSDIRSEAKQVMENLQAIVEGAGYQMDQTVKCTIYLTDLGQFGVVNEVYSNYFHEAPPARETVQVAALPRGARVEISLIAVK